MLLRPNQRQRQKHKLKGTLVNENVQPKRANATPLVNANAHANANERRRKRNHKIIENKKETRFKTAAPHPRVLASSYLKHRVNNLLSL